MIGVIVALVIGLLLVIAFVVGPGAFGQEDPNTQREDGLGETTVGRAMLKGKDTDCQASLKQVRLAIEIQTDPVDDTHPASLDNLKLGEDMTHCAVGGELYEYDPATGEVHCPHPGHEKY